MGRIEDSETEAKDTALRFLGYGDRTCREITDRLRRDGYGDAVIENVLCFLKEYNYVNDKRFAEAYTEELIGVKGYGKKRIRHELYLKGISSDIIEYAVRDYAEEDEVYTAVALLNKKFANRPGSDRSPAGDPKRYISYLLRRGFTYRTARSALERYGYDCDAVWPEEDAGAWMEE